jgi:hypothetical protein
MKRAACILLALLAGVCGTEGSALWVVPNGSHVPIHGPIAEHFQDEVRAFVAGERKRR